MHEVLVNRLGGLNLPRKSVVRLSDRPDMTLVVFQVIISTVKTKSFQKDHLDKVGTEISLLFRNWVYTVAIPSAHCCRTAITDQ